MNFITEKHKQITKIEAIRTQSNRYLDASTSNVKLSFTDPGENLIPNVF